MKLTYKCLKRYFPPNIACIRYVHNKNSYFSLDLLFVFRKPAGLCQKRTKKKAINYIFTPIVLSSEILKWVPGNYPTTSIFHLPSEPLTQQITIGFTDLGNTVRVIFSHGWIVLKQFLQCVRHTGCSLASGMRIHLVSFFALIQTYLLCLPLEKPPALKLPHFNISPFIPFLIPNKNVLMNFTTSVPFWKSHSLTWRCNCNRTTIRMYFTFQAEIHWHDGHRKKSITSSSTNLSRMKQPSSKQKGLFIFSPQKHASKPLTVNPECIPIAD